MGEILSHDKGELPVESDASKAEHLAEGIRPIMACVGTREQYGEEIAEIKDIEDIGRDVDFYSDSGGLNKGDFRSAGARTYVISPIDSKPKFTRELHQCTSLVAVGRDIGSGKELSFLTHQSEAVLRLARDSFATHLKSRLEELKKRCSSGSIDIVIAGGQFWAPKNQTAYHRALTELNQTEYQGLVALLDAIVQEMLGFEPLVVVGPKDSLKDDVYFDTPNRRLYVIRPSSSQDGPVPLLHNDAFKLSEIEKMKKKWKEETIKGPEDPKH